MSKNKQLIEANILRNQYNDITREIIKLQQNKEQYNDIEYSKKLNKLKENKRLYKAQIDSLAESIIGRNKSSINLKHQLEVNTKK